jgi:NnrU protein
MNRHFACVCATTGTAPLAAEAPSRREGLAIQHCARHRRYTPLDSSPHYSKLHDFNLQEVAMSLLVAGLFLFLGIHLVPALPPMRHALAERWGEGPFKITFSVVSAAGLALIVIGYARWPQPERLFAPLPAAIAIAPLAMTVAFILFAAANMRGYLRHILRHPMLLGLLIWSFVHLLANGDLKGTLLFGAFLAYAVLDLVSATARNATKSFSPHLKFDAFAVIGGIAVAVTVMALHRIFFGVNVVSFGV